MQDGRTTNGPGRLPIPFFCTVLSRAQTEADAPPRWCFLREYLPPTLIRDAVFDAKDEMGNLSFAKPASISSRGRRGPFHFLSAIKRFCLPPLIFSSCTQQGVFFAKFTPIAAG